MKILFIGGTGNISTSSSRLSIERGSTKAEISGVKTILSAYNAL